jgi:hypothetical protein
LGLPELQRLVFRRGGIWLEAVTGWQKRAQEMARKEQNHDKMKRRQGKTPASPAAELPVVVE